MVLPPGTSFSLDANGTPGWANTVSASLLAPLWFLSLYQWLIGSAFPGTIHLAWTAAALGTLAPLLALAFYAASYRRLTRLAIEGRLVPRSLRAPLSSRLVTAHRGRSLMPLPPLPCARHNPDAGAQPAAPHAAGGVDRRGARPDDFRGGPDHRSSGMERIRSSARVAARRPADFRRADPDGHALPVRHPRRDQGQLDVPRARTAAACAGAGGGLRRADRLRRHPSGHRGVPLCHCSFGECRQGVAHAVFCGVLATGLVQILMRGADKVPFTCTYTPGTAHIGKLWPLYLTAFSVFWYSMADLESGLLKNPRSFAMTIAIVAALPWS